MSLFHKSNLIETLDFFSLQNDENAQNAAECIRKRGRRTGKGSDNKHTLGLINSAIRGVQMNRGGEGGR